MKVEELQAIIAKGGGKFRHVFIGQTSSSGIGVLVAFSAPNGETFTLPVTLVTEKSVRAMIRTTQGWRRLLYLLYNLLSEG
jgi:hypothetical protein